MPIIKSLTIENFKGIGQKVSFDFKPITLFFGQNSAGKSTVLHAINYLHDILNYHTINADNTSLGHDAIDLGGFKQFVHHHDLDKVVALELILDLRDVELIETDSSKSYLDFLSSFENDEDEYKRLDISPITSDVNFAGLRLQIGWSGLLKRPYVKQFNVDLNGKPFVQLSASSDCKRREITKINMIHPLFTEAFEEEGLYALTQFIIDNSFLDAQGNSIIGFENAVDALPDHHKPLSLMDIWNDEAIEDLGQKNKFKGILSALLMGPLEVAANTLLEMRYLGPMRDVPHRNYTPKPSESKNWSNGLAAWDLLFKENLTLLKDVNEWLNSPDAEVKRLNTGYEIKIDEYRQFQLGSRLEGLLNVSDLNQNKEEIEQLLLDMPVKQQFVLNDVRRGVDVFPSDVGVGISQLLPVVVGALAKKISILSIEQPELHIHPALQVALGDLLIFASKQKNKSFIIETHSEHLMLRLLRRIRETSGDELENTDYAFDPDDLNVVYVECIEGETRLIPLRVDDDGEFIDRWPNGFFGERAEELF